MSRLQIRVLAPFAMAMSSALVALVFASAGLAHSEAGEMEILTLGQKGENTIIIEVGLVFADDGHIAEEATVTATVRGPGGPYSTELDRVGDGSRYSGTVDVDQPGEFRVVVESEDPEAKASGDVSIEEISDEAGPEEPTAAPAEPEAQENPRPDGDVESASEESEAADDGPPWALIAIGGLLLINGIVIGYWLYTRNRAGQDGGAQ